ncbi:HTH-type transcriptional activator RhaS [Kordia sp. SMS9]|uniref:helix-turn-helix domain-containing protein n=1 Tax=Kordia sp. SMS9 TaxID=2282170 RepID=UPI000E0D1B0E|nr:helix-turn-helix domain-containing protein [Kordia sp. SMS9]AXG71790.1 HTH-type transcriptional activator RhaS [Kordia sp. SMS9]
MSKTSFTGDFLAKAEAIVLENISNEQFGVSELAAATNMSRSNLLRKIKKQTELSASQFIRNIRLSKGKELLVETELTVSEISYEVGFGNTSYFIKCFRELYGVPPGEIRKKPLASVEEITEETIMTTSKSVENYSSQKSFFNAHFNKIIVVATAITIVLISFLWKEQSNDDLPTKNRAKSIAVLPFKNMSSDSTNYYFVNGLMESSLNNLQKIEDLRVISRTSVEKYRNTTKTIAEIANELNVNYIVEGSGQKIDDEVLLHIQLIDATNDTPIWTEQYKHQLVDIFSLQNTVAKKIAMSIQATVTPAELAQIDKKPTENLEAYDVFLRGLEPLQKQTQESLFEAIELFKKATELDPKFSLAYAKAAMAYFYLDVYQREKKYTNELNENADKALLYDSKSDQSLIAKALYYVNNREINLAVPHLEKALEYNPNAAAVVLILSDLYARAIPNTEKYLKYALKGIQLNIQANDSVGKSFIYLHLGNALIQSGFVNEADTYMKLAHSYNPQNQFTKYIQAYINYAKHRDIKKCTNQLVTEWKKDTLRIDLLQEIGKVHYYEEDYETAYHYYKKYNALQSDQKIDIFPQENLKIAIVYEKMGDSITAKKHYDKYITYCENDTSMYQSASVAMRYLYEGDKDAAIAQLKLFATKNNFQYWLILFWEADPLMRGLKTHPEYNATFQKIKDRFWENHAETKKTLEENGLL